MYGSVFQCTVCGFIYENNDGRATSFDRLSSFEQLPTTWQCPHCGVLKNLFRATTQTILNDDTTAPKTNGDVQ